MHLAPLLALALVIAPGPQHFDLAPKDDGWTPARTDQDVTVFTKAFPGSGVYGLRSDGVIDAPLVRVASLLLDLKHMAQWVDRLAEERMVRQIDPLTYVEYNHFKLPLILSDRDFLTKVQLKLLPEARSFAMEAHTTEDALQPVGDPVRGELHSYYLMTSIENGTKTRLQVIYVMDPKGSIPQFVVNSYSKDWPVGTYVGIRKRAKSDAVREPEEFKVLFDELRKL
jgi:hypothetical protein